MEKLQLVFATNNEHKLEELRQIAGDNIKIVSLNEIGCHQEIPETGETLEENALQKARFINEHYGMNCIADDTGLEVDALNGAPGVCSARYAAMAKGKEKCTPQENVELLLEQLQGEENRTARFRTVIALILDGQVHTFHGVVEGEITNDASGKGGFGYDPIFKPEGWTETFAEASAEAKNAISHRGRASRALLEWLRQKGF